MRTYGETGYADGLVALIGQAVTETDDLILAKRADASAPLIGMCEPTRCANATTHPEHVPVWIDTARGIDRLLASARVPNQEKQRLRLERERVKAVGQAATAPQPS